LLNFDAFWHISVVGLYAGKGYLSV
jgi:hypothetical protein